jgi:N-acetylgalactosamine kinase
MAEKGSAMLIHFDPLETVSRVLPTGVDFIIANSLVESNKRVTAATNYNLRVIECRLAAKLLGKVAGVDHEMIHTLRDFQEARNLTLLECLDHVLLYLHMDFYTDREICQLLQMDFLKFQKDYTQKYQFAENQKFQLYRRARHVFSEALRVEHFFHLCDEDQIFNVDRLEVC